MNQLVANAIAENLPTDISKIITERLQFADRAKSELEAAQTELSKSKTKVGELSDKIVALSSKLDEHDALDKREQDLEKAARDLEVAMLQQKIELMGEAHNKMAEHTALLLRNTEFRRNYWDEHKDITVSDYSSTNGGVVTNHSSTPMPASESSTAS